MGKKDPATVETPDPYDVARADARFNRIDQITPYGNLTYSGPDRNIATLSLGDELQNIFDQRLQVDDAMIGSALDRLAGFDPSQIDLSQFGPIQSDAGLQQFDPSTLGLPAIPTDLEGYRSNVEDALFNRADRLMAPVFQRQESQLLDRLANQGLPQGNQAYNTELDVFGDNVNQAYADLADRAVLAGGAESSRLLADALGARGQLFGEGLSTVGFNNAALQQALMNQNAARTQGLNEAMGIRGNAFNELASLLGLQQVQAPQMQNFFAPGQVDMIGAQNLAMQGQMFNANQQNQMNAAALGGLYGLGSAALTGGMGMFGAGGAFAPGGRFGR